MLWNNFIHLYLKSVKHNKTKGLHGKNKNGYNIMNNIQFGVKSIINIRNI